MANQPTSFRRYGLYSLMAPIPAAVQMVSG